MTSRANRRNRSEPSSRHIFGISSPPRNNHTSCIHQQATAANALANLHVVLHHGRNSHHISEAIFKSAARALRMAVESDPRMPGVPSTKGTLGE